MRLGQGASGRILSALLAALFLSFSALPLVSAATQGDGHQCSCPCPKGKCVCCRRSPAGARGPRIAAQPECPSSCGRAAVLTRGASMAAPIAAPLFALETRAFRAETHPLPRPIARPVTVPYERPPPALSRG
jgi:hypothetical protein